MINKLQTSNIINSLGKFTGHYYIKLDCTHFLGQLCILGHIHNGDCYPQLIIPSDILSRLNEPFIRGYKFRESKKGVYLQDLIREAKKLDSSFSDIEYLHCPESPIMPIIENVSETKTITVTNEHIGCWCTIALLLLGICACTAILSGNLGAGVLYSLSFLPFFLLMAHECGAMKSTEEIKTVRLSEKEIIQKKKEAKENYEVRLMQYQIEKLSYEKSLENYRLRQRENMSRIEVIFDKIFWSLKGNLRSTVQIHAKRAAEIPQRGRSENLLFEKLMQRMPNYVKIDMQVGHYFPDICIIIPDILALDIEIDEPYAGPLKTETHYLDCGDDLRNEIFVNNGWYVLRFSEEQVVKQTEKCVEIIGLLVSIVCNGRFDGLNELSNLMHLIETPRWTKEQARLMAIKKSRELY